MSVTKPSGRHRIQFDLEDDELNTFDGIKSGFKEKTDVGAVRKALPILAAIVAGARIVVSPMLPDGTFHMYERIDPNKGFIR